MIFCILNKKTGEKMNIRKKVYERYKIDWISRYGYHGCLYPCFEEFLETEYQDIECMYSILTPGEFKEYLEDII